MGVINKLCGWMPGVLLCTVFINQAAVAGPEIQSWTTTNGSRVLFVAAPSCRCWMSGWYSMPAVRVMEIHRDLRR